MSVVLDLTQRWNLRANAGDVVARDLGGPLRIHGRRTERSRIRCSISTLCCPSLFIATNFLPGALRRFPDRLRIRRIGLVMLHERTHELSGDQPPVMPIPRKPPPPVVRTATGLHRPHRRLAPGEELCHLGPLPLPPADLARLHITQCS